MPVAIATSRIVTTRRAPPLAGLSAGIWGAPLFLRFWPSAGTGGSYPSCFQSSGK
jgi:hypothetical protein